MLEKMEYDRIKFLEAPEKNSSLPKSFRNEIKTAVEEFNNMALDSLGEVLEKNAETDDEKAEVRRILDESKRK